MKLTGIDLLDGHGWRRGMDVEIAHGRIARSAPARAATTRPSSAPRPSTCKSMAAAAGCWARLPGPRRRAGHPRRPPPPRHRRDPADADLRHPETTRRVTNLVATARRADDGILGLHLEGPHIARPGAHDPAHLRDLTDADIATYREAKARVDHLLITLAPERATPAQIAQLASAGIIVSLGHTDCTHDQAEAAFAAGARMATHLFNAMSGLNHREPGLVGATLSGARDYGIIADGIHVADAALRIALAAHPEGAIPVSDAMAVAGTKAEGFDLGTRRVHRRDGRLTLDDGTLAGADISLVGALRHIAGATDQPLAQVLPMGFDRPHRLLTGKANRLGEGAPARLLLIDGDRIEGFDGYSWRVLAG
jgi:N-acetylglucosamine-6-phosphate deacetylase